MKPEKFIGIMVITLLLSCDADEQASHKLGEVVFESNQDIINSTFEIEAYIDGKKLGIINKQLRTKLKIGVHDYEIKIYSYNGEPAKSLKGRIIINENKTSEVFIDFKKYNSWV
jgi:hypothetical protein